MAELKGHISISRPHGHDGPDYINIEIIDLLSGIQFVECHIELADFSEAITGMGHTSCTFIPRGLDGVGKTRETKVVRVFVPSSERNPNIVRAAVAEHETDGWKGRDADAVNHHKIVSRTKEGHFASVHFSRLVETPA